MSSMAIGIAANESENDKIGNESSVAARRAKWQLNNGENEKMK
jgi:hypothetical protein